MGIAPETPAFPETATHPGHAERRNNELEGEKAFTEIELALKDSFPH